MDYIVSKTTMILRFLCKYKFNFKVGIYNEFRNIILNEGLIIEQLPCTGRPCVFLPRYQWIVYSLLHLIYAVKKNNPKKSVPINQTIRSGEIDIACLLVRLL